MKRAKRILSLCLICLLLGPDILNGSVVRGEPLATEMAENVEVTEETDGEEITGEEENPEEVSEEEEQNNEIAVQSSVSNERLDGDYAYISDAGMVSDSQSSTKESI